jgi:hypothetical protein
MNTIKIELSIEETNLILEALGQQPFARVYALIGRIQELARSQLQVGNHAAKENALKEAKA